VATNSVSGKQAARQAQDDWQCFYTRQKNIGLNDITAKAEHSQRLRETA
jgi:hypothetical protein